MKGEMETKRQKLKTDVGTIYYSFSDARFWNPIFYLTFRQFTTGDWSAYGLEGASLHLFFLLKKEKQGYFLWENSSMVIIYIKKIKKKHS